MHCVQGPHVCLVTCSRGTRSWPSTVLFTWHYGKAVPRPRAALQSPKPLLAHAQGDPHTLHTCSAVCGCLCSTRTLLQPRALHGCHRLFPSVTWPYFTEKVGNRREAIASGHPSLLRTKTPSPPSLQQPMAALLQGMHCHCHPLQPRHGSRQGSPPRPVPSSISSREQLCLSCLQHFAESLFWPPWLPPPSQRVDTLQGRFWRSPCLMAH